MTSDPRGSFTTADLKVSYRLRKHCSLSARPPSPRSGPPLTTNRVGSPPVWESITLTFRQALFVMCVRTVCKDYLMDTICNRQTCMFEVAQCETESKRLKRRYLPNKCHASYLSLDTTCDILNSAPRLMQQTPRTDLESPSYSGIPRQSLPSAVADKLREQIIRGEIPEGAQLRQDAIANQYQVSRIPVREALRQLDAEGLIAIVPNRGAIVPALSPSDIGELFSIRALLEPEVLKQSIPLLTEEDFSEAEAVLREYVSELRRPDHLSAWGRLNWQFHSILYSRANQPRFLAIIRNVNNSGERYTRLQLYLTHGVKRANEEHHQILEFCRQRDITAACGLLREHILHAGHSLKEVLEQKRKESQHELETAGRRSKS